jgi:hypothetical protein
LYQAAHKINREQLVIPLSRETLQVGCSFNEWPDQSDSYDGKDILIDAQSKSTMTMTKQRKLME